MKHIILTVMLALWLTIASAVDGKPRSPFDYEVLTYLWVAALSAFGGLANFARKLRDGQVRAFNLVELLGEVVISSFAGLLTFWLTEYANMDKLLSAALIAISGHMGSRAIFLLERAAEKWLEQRIGKGS